MTPNKIGRYEIKSELGRGGMATVYRAYDPRFEREVALKVLPRELMHDGSFRVRFEREAKTIASLEHPAIVPVYDVGEDDNQPYFVMRLMAGGSLGEVIDQGPMPLQEAARIMNRLGPALDEAHAKGIIHRDLKPGNILFDRVREPYISDFGIAKIAQSQSGSTVTGGAIIGTPAYMSPEQAQGDPVDGRSDIYALGVILYEMLSGTQPYQATTPMAVVVKHITDPIPHILDTNPKLPAGIETIIEKAMAKNPDQRFATAGELAAALDALSHGQSAEDALKTATLSVTRIQAAKTRMAGKTDVQRAKAAATGGAAANTTGGFSPMVFVVPVIGGLALLVIAGLAAAYFLFGPGKASLFPTETPAIVVPPATETVEAGATDGPTETAEPDATFTPAPETATPTPDVPRLPAVGGADMVAFLANGDVWLMNIDGSNLHPLTNDRGVKSGLQWMPDGETLVYISGKNIYTVNAVTESVDILMTFPNTSFLDAFRISPDGQQVAISMNREMFIVPFDIEALKNAHNKGDLLEMEGCLEHSPGTLSADAAREFRWSDDSKLLSWMFTGKDLNARDADLIRIFDITPCDPTRINKIDEFPGVRFETSRPVISDYDWDGTSLFVFNTFLRNDGWGDLYTYNGESHKGTALAPVGGKCCYRDARFSPDGTYVIFAFQDRNLSSNAPTLLYYLPFGALETGSSVSPIPMPESFFKNQREPVEPALHIAP